MLFSKPSQEEEGLQQSDYVCTPLIISGIPITMMLLMMMLIMLLMIVLLMMLTKKCHGLMLSETLHSSFDKTCSQKSTQDNYSVETTNNVLPQSGDWLLLIPGRWVISKH